MGEKEQEFKTNLIEKQKKIGYSNQKWQQMFKKKWVFPVIYIVIAITGVSMIWEYQNNKIASVKKESIQVPTIENKIPAEKPIIPESIAVHSQVETMQWPIKDRSEVTVLVPYYDSKSSIETKMAAIVNHDHELSPHSGIDLKNKEDKSFDVMAVMSGRVSSVEYNPLTGHHVEIEHENGLISIYESLSDIKIKQDSKVKKGDIVGKAGRNEIEKELGIHVHFEIRSGENKQTINPEKLLK